LHTYAFVAARENVSLSTALLSLLSIGLLLNTSVVQAHSQPPPCIGNAFSSLSELRLSIPDTKLTVACLEVLFMGLPNLKRLSLSLSFHNDDLSPGPFFLPLAFSRGAARCPFLNIHHSFA
jgi:hypothetical protein